MKPESYASTKAIDVQALCVTKTSGATLLTVQGSSLCSKRKDFTIFDITGGRELGLFLRCWLPWTMWANPLIILSTTTRDVWITPSFQIWGYVLHIDHVICVITNCDQHQWIIPSPLSIAVAAHYQKIIISIFRLIFKILLFQDAFLISFSVAIFSSHFLLVGLLLNYVSLFQSGELVLGLVSL